MFRHSSILARIAGALIRMSAPHGTLRQTEAVYALADADLASRGLLRRDAAWQVMVNGDWR